MDLLCKALRFLIFLIAVVSMVGLLITTIQGLKRDPEALFIIGPFERAKYQWQHVPRKRMLNVLAWVGLLFAAVLITKLFAPICGSNATSGVPDVFSISPSQKDSDARGFSDSDANE